MNCVCVTLAALCSDVGSDDFDEFISVWSSLPSLFLSAVFQLASQSAADFVVEPVVMPLEDDEEPVDGAVVDGLAEGEEVEGEVVDDCATAAVARPSEQMAIASDLSIFEGSFVSRRVGWQTIGACRGSGGTRPTCASGLRENFREVGEELVGILFRNARDETAAQLGDLPADFRFDVVDQLRAARVRIFETNLRTTLRKP